MRNLDRRDLAVMGFIIVCLVIYKVMPRISERQEITPQSESTPEQRWKIRVADSVNCNMNTTVPTWDIFFDMVDKQERCAEMKTFGAPEGVRNFDGAKQMCMDGAMAPRPGACTVMSFGIADQWTFDEAMAERGCQVFSFDPTIPPPSQEMNAKIHFHSLGLHGRKGTFDFRGNLVPVDSYRGVLEHVGLINHTIDYLKIDIEGSEIDFFENVLFEDIYIMQHVKQIGVEIHVWEKNVQSRDQLWKILHRLACLGFKQVSSEINMNGGYIYGNERQVSCCYELVLINQAFL